MVPLAGPRRVSSDRRHRTRRANPVLAPWLFLGLVRRRRAAAQRPGARARRRWSGLDGVAARWAQRPGEARRTCSRGHGGSWHGHHRCRRNGCYGCPQRTRCVGGSIALRLRGQVVQVVVCHRAVVQRGRSPCVGDGVLLVRRRLCEGARCLEGAETGPERDNGKKEGNHPTGHAIHCGERGNCPTLEARSSQQPHRGCWSKFM